jgi:hypothetical protein
MLIVVENIVTTKADIIITVKVGINSRQNSILNLFICLYRLDRFWFYFAWQGFVAKISSSKMADEKAQ